MNKKIILNFIKSLIGVALVSPFFTLVKNNESFIEKNNLNSNKNTTQKQTISTISAYSDYDAMFSDANTPIVSNEYGVIGKSKDSGIVIMTSYNGSIAWMTDIRTIEIVKEYYKSLGIDDITNYTIKSWIPINNEFLAILFSDSSKNNSIVLALNLNNGKIYSPSFDVNGEIGYSKNIVKVSDGSSVLFEASYPQKSLYVFPEGIGNNLVNKVYQVTISDKGISSLNMNNNMLSENANDHFVGFVSGTSSALNNYLLFLKHDTKEYYIKVFNQFLEEVKNSQNTNIKIDTTINFSKVDSGHITNENEIPKHAFKASNSSKTNDKIIFVFYGQNAKIRLYDFNANSKSLENKSEYSFSNSQPYRTSRLNNSNEIFYSIEKTTDNTIFAIVDMGQGNSNNQTISSDKKVKLGTEQNQYSKPWSFVDVKSSSNKAYLFIDTVSNPSKIKREYSTSQTNDNLSFSNSIELTFNKYTISTTFANQKIASTITDEELKRSLTYSNNSMVSNETLSITDKETDNDNGKIKFNYRISYTSWWDNKQISFFIPNESNSAYKLSEFKFKFVTSENINATKFAKINELKSTKYANAITKQEILDNFIESDIKDKDGATFTLTQNMITLTPNENKDTLKVDINMLADSATSSKLPSGINSFSAYYKQSYSFSGFLSLNGYNFLIENSIPSNISSKLPSEISFYDVIENIITLGPSYSKALSDWEYEYEANDIDGTFTIKRFVYRKSVDSEFPQDKKNIIITNKVYSNLKNSISLMNGQVRISDLDKTQTINKKPTEIWKEYSDALNDSNSFSVEKTLIYKSIQQNVVVDKKDLTLTITNLDTADLEHKLKFRVEIKNNALLIPKIKNQNLVFSEQFKTKLISTKPNYYPFNLTQNIELLSYEFDWNYQSQQKDGFTLNNSKTELTIDLDKTNWDNLSNNLTAKEFVNSINSYYNQIENLFLYNNNYEMKINDPILNSSDGIVWIRVDFIPKSPDSNLMKINRNTFTKNNALSTISKQIVIRGFKIPFSPVVKLIPFVAIILLTISMIVLSVFMFIRSSKKKSYNENKFRKEIKPKEKKKYL